EASALVAMDDLVHLFGGRPVVPRDAERAAADGDAEGVLGEVALEGAPHELGRLGLAQVLGPARVDLVHRVPPVVRRPLSGSPKRVMGSSGPNHSPVNSYCQVQRVTPRSLSQRPRSWTSQAWRSSHPASFEVR